MCPNLSIALEPAPLTGVRAIALSQSFPTAKTQSRRDYPRKNDVWGSSRCACSAHNTRSSRVGECYDGERSVVAASGPWNRSHRHIRPGSTVDQISAVPACVLLRMRRVHVKPALQSGRMSQGHRRTQTLLASLTRSRLKTHLSSARPDRQPR